MVWVFRLGNYGLGVGVLGLRFGGMVGWVVRTHTHTFYKFTHEFFLMLYLVTILCCKFNKVLLTKLISSVTGSLIQSFTDYSL